MGCTDSRSTSSEERAIALSESALGFQLCWASDVDMIVRKNSFEGLINNSQFERIRVGLRIPTENYGSHSKITLFYNKLRGETGEIFAKDLLVIGILLSTGSPPEKAKLIYQIFDYKSTEMLTPEDIRNSVLNVLVKYSLMLATLVDDKNYSFPDRQSISDYCDRLAKVQDDAINRVIEKITTRSSPYVKEERFVKVLAEILEGKLTSASGWRCYLRDVVTTTPTKLPLQLWISDQLELLP